MTAGAVEFVDGEQVRVGGITFSYGVPPPTDASTAMMPVFKSRVLLEQLIGTLERLRPMRIVELGIHRGGSVALIAWLSQPDKMVALDLSEPVAQLQAFLEQHQLTAIVIPYYGVDQGDSARLGEILDVEFGERSIDFVIDDASHLYGPSRRSFEVLFPRLRPGGVYVVEDWAAQHTLGATIVDSIIRRRPGWEDQVERLASSTASLDPVLADSLRRDPQRATLVEASRLGAAEAAVTPLSRLGLELVHAAAESRHIVRSIGFTQGWIEVERGQGEISGEGWLGSASMDLFGSLSSLTR